MPKRIRELYREIRDLTGHGGTFLNLDYVRPARAELARLSDWITRDERGRLRGAPHDVANMPGTLQEHLGWLGEAGFGTVEVYWKEMDLALLSGINGHLHMPWGHGDDPNKALRARARALMNTSTGRIDGMTQENQEVCTATAASRACTRMTAAPRTGTTSSASTCSRT